jgi:hypothetical protein
MKIEGPRRSSATSGPKRAGQPRGDGFQLEDTGGTGATKASAALGATRGLSGVDALLALQGEMDGSARRKRMTDRAGDLLDILDEIKLTLLSGAYPKSTLPRLLDALERQREDVMDPRLQTVLDEIELRARVEAAKLEAA